MTRPLALLAFLPLLAACGTSVGPPPDDAPSSPGDVRTDVPVVMPPDDVPVVMPPEDVPVVMPPDDVPTGALPTGAACMLDRECQSGVCVTAAGIAPGGCGVPCQHDVDCDRLGGAQYCALERTATGGRWVCGAIAGSTGFDAAGCTTDAQCVSNFCAGAVCHAACTADSECTGGQRCVPTYVGASMLNTCSYAPVGGVRVDDIDLVNGPISVDRGGTFGVAIPPDAVSLTFVAQDLEGAELFAGVPRIAAPDGSLWVDSMTWSILRDQPVRELITQYQINSVLAPSSSTLRVLPGHYDVVYALFNDRTAMTHVAMRRMRGYVRVKRAPGGILPATGTLHIGIYVVGLADMTAATAPSNARLRAAVASMNATYAAAGISVVVDGYANVAAAAATRLSVIDSRDELQELLSNSVPGAGELLNIFLVRGISATAGLENAIGVAGDIVGPTGIHGTIHSGVVVGWESTIGGRRDLLGQVFGHESGHYLGLWHTRESQAACTMAGQTMCAPFGGVDPIADTPTDDAGSSRYLMHWSTADGSNVAISPGEARVMRGNPLVR